MGCGKSGWYAAAPAVANRLASRAPTAKDCADCGLADCRLELASRQFRGFGPPQAPLSSADSESARNMPQNSPVGSFGDRFEATPGPAHFQ
eukprot:12168767-Alexandrium_andersonii.AAC.1